MKYKINYQTFNRLPLDAAAWKSKGLTGASGASGSTGSYMTTINSRKITTIGSTGPLSAGELKSQLKAKNPNSNPLYLENIIVGNTSVSDSTILNYNDQIIFNQIFTPKLKRYRRSTLPAPIPRPNNVGPTGGTGSTGITGPTSS
jgi:hypothetical protein